MSGYSDISKRMLRQPTRVVTAQEIATRANSGSKLTKHDGTFRVATPLGLKNKILRLPSTGIATSGHAEWLVGLQYSKMYLTLNIPFRARFDGRLIFQYNCSADEDFILSDIKREFGSDGYAGISRLCVMVLRWRIGETVYRYKIFGPWFGLNENPAEYGPLKRIPYYNGETIKKNFCIEVYGANTVTGPSMSADYEVYATDFKTSILYVPSTFGEVKEIATAVPTWVEDGLSFEMPVEHPIAQPNVAWLSN